MFTYLLTYLLAQWSEVLLQKLAGSQLVKKFAAFYRARRFITASHVPANCPFPEPDQSSPLPPYPNLWRSILILSSHLGLGLQIELIPSGFLTNTLYTPLLSTNRAICPGHSHSWYDHPKNVWSEVQIIKLLMRFSPLLCYLVRLRPKCLPQHPILEHPHPRFLPQCERPSFTPVQKQNRQTTFVHLIWS